MLAAVHAPGTPELLKAPLLTWQQPPATAGHGSRADAMQLLAATAGELSVILGNAEQPPCRAGDAAKTDVIQQTVKQAVDIKQLRAGVTSEALAQQVICQAATSAKLRLLAHGPRDEVPGISHPSAAS